MLAAAMTWLPAQAQGETPLDRVFGLRPNLYAAYRDFAALFWERRVLPPRVLELCRLLVARLHGCESELRLRHRPALEAGLREAQVAALGSGDESEFDAAERACLRFAEMFVRDPHAICDEDAAAVAAQVGEPGLVALAEALAVFDGFCRFRILLGVEPETGPLRVVDAPKPGRASAW
jgi:alkylhydroperoxidase family enzyme